MESLDCNRLCVGLATFTGRGVTCVPYGEVTGQSVEIELVKCLVQETHLSVEVEIVAISSTDTSTFLSAVL